MGKMCSMQRRTGMSCVVAGWMFAAGVPAVRAQGGYPKRVVTLVTHSSPGGGSDVFLRALGKHLGPKMGVNLLGLIDTGADEVLIPDVYMGLLGVASIQGNQATIAAVGGVDDTGDGAFDRQFNVARRACPPATQEALHRARVATVVHEVRKSGGIRRHRRAIDPTNLLPHRINSP